MLNTLEVINFQEEIMIHKMFAYHTCKNKGGTEYIKNNVPFLSGKDKQWLTQGYYFWTDSTYWAKKWLKDGIISKFRIEIPSEKFLDLVGNVQQQEEFFKSFTILSEELKSVSDEDEEIEELTISGYILIMRNGNNEKLFPYWAIKAKDNRYEESINFIEGRKEKMNFIERQQLCVFEDYKKNCVFLLDCDV